MTRSVLRRSTRTNHQEPALTYYPSKTRSPFSAVFHVGRADRDEETLRGAPDRLSGLQHVRWILLRRELRLRPQGTFGVQLGISGAASPITCSANCVRHRIVRYVGCSISIPVFTVNTIRESRAAGVFSGTLNLIS
jgi:hypothetical protein